MTGVAQIKTSWVPVASIPSPIQNCVNNAPGGYAAYQCLITINRDAPVSPPTLLLPGGTTVYLRLTGSHWDEQIAFNNATVRTAPQDIATDALKSLVTPLSNLVGSVGYAEAMVTPEGQPPPPPPPPPGPPPADAQITAAQTAIGAALQNALDDIQDATTTLTCLETYKPVVNVGSNVSCDQSGSLNPSALTTAPGTPLQNAIDAANSAASDTLPVVELKAADALLKKATDACSALPLGDPCYAMYDYDQTLENLYTNEITTLQTAQGTLLQAVQVLTTWPGHPVDVAFEAKLDKNYTATITIVGTEIITKTATTIATVTVNSQTTKVILSTGLMYTTTPFRNYAIADQIAGGSIVPLPGGGTSVTPTEIISKTTSDPSIDFPVVFGSYTIPWLSRANWENRCPNHCAVLFSLGVGLNLGAKTADLAGGPSFQIGGFLITLAAVGARQNQLLDGLYVGQTNFGAANPTSLQTGTHWTVGGGIALTYTIATP